MIVGTCGVCGGKTARGADYTAQSDEGGTLTKLPGVVCLDCGAIRPDSERVRKMAPDDVPSGVRLRCASPYHPLRGIGGVRFEP
jgi:hypothetical protein